MDYGQAILIDRPVSPGVNSSFTYTQWGTGLGFLLNVGESFDARLSLAWALLNTPTTGEGELQAYFTVGAQF
jgi:hemolysin activation/secretion protein